MSIHTTRTITATRVEVEIPSPCVAGDLTDASAEARRHVPADRGDYDDAYRVEARDDRIVFVVDVDEQLSRSRHVALAEIADALDGFANDISTGVAVSPVRLLALADKIRGPLS